MSAVGWPHGQGCRICVSLAEPTVAELIARFDRLDGAEIIEVRLDALEAPEATAASLTDIIAAAPVPVGFTYRPVWQGGAFDGDEESRRALLQHAAERGAAFVDVELEAEWAAEFVQSSASPVVLSHHWWEPTTPDLERMIARALDAGPAMVKLVGTAVAADDAVPFLHAAARFAAEGVPSTCFCMGDAGRASRLIAAARGGALIYASPEAGSEVAAGQWSVSELVETFRVPEWAPYNEIYGLIGDPIGHSLSPAIFNAAFVGAGASRAYVPLAGADLDAVLRLAHGAEVRGVSVTMPFKAPMAARSAPGDTVVARTGAANTVSFAGDDKWTAFNTDGVAVVDALAQLRDPAGARVAIIGAGGAARGAAAALVDAGAEVFVLNRTPDRAAEAAELTGAGHGAIADLEGGNFDVVINATPVGMHGSPQSGETPFPTRWLTGDEIVFDMVYRPRGTPLLRAADECGCSTIEGLEMFVRQAAAQYRHLTGDPGDGPLALMRETTERILGEDATVAQKHTAGGTSEV